MNEDYYHEQNSCYDYNSFGFDQFQPPQYTVNHPIFNAQNELLNSQNELLNSQNEFLNSSNKLMEQMTTLCDMVGQAIQKKEEEKRIAEEQAAEDRYWKIPICYDDDGWTYTIAFTPVLPTKEGHALTSLIPRGIPSDSSVLDVPLCYNHTSLDAFKIIRSNLSDVMDQVFSTSLNLFLEETNTFDNSLSESETFCFDLEENSSGSTTTLSNYSLLDYEAFYDHIEEKNSGSTTTYADFS
ncbi:hypothetical protein Tco_0808062 [Tanacetum coccineum]